MVRTQIILKEKQREALRKIAKQKHRSISDIVREFLDEQLRLQKELQMKNAAELLKKDYKNDEDLTIFTALDSEEFHEKR